MAILKPHFELQDNCPILQSNMTIKLFDYGIYPGWLANKETIVFMAITLLVLPYTCMRDLYQNLIQEVLCKNYWWNNKF